MALIAGHVFVDGRCSCGRRWVNIRHVDVTYLNETGYAHVGNLNMAEIGQIVQARTDEEARVAAAIYDIARSPA